jgi:hypothetical protein
MNLIDVLYFLIENGPGRTEDELVKAIWGARAGEPIRGRNLPQHSVEEDTVVQLTSGGKGDPHHYYPADSFVKKSP